MNDWWIYFILFLIGGVVTFLEEASKDCKSLFNRKVLKFLPIKHIFSVIAIVLCIIALILYCLNKSNRMISLILCFIGIGLLAIVIILDIYIISKKHKK